MSQEKKGLNNKIVTERDILNNNTCLRPELEYHQRWLKIEDVDEAVEQLKKELIGFTFSYKRVCNIINKIFKGVGKE